MYFKPVVYCDQERQAHVLHSISAPRSVSELQHYIDDQLHFHSQVLSYWNYTHRQYELLTSIDALIQPEALLMRSDEESRNRINLTGTSKGLLSSSSSSLSLLQNNSSTTKTTYRAQLWAESSFVQLEPIINNFHHHSENLNGNELNQLAEHIRSFAGNGFITYKLLHAARIRYTYLARMFDETRRILAQKHNSSSNNYSDNVKMMFYMNNAWSLLQVISHGFYLCKNVTEFTEYNVIHYKEIEAKVQEFIESITKENVNAVNEKLSNMKGENCYMDELTYDHSWKSRKEDNSELHPFAFATSLRSPHERVPPFSAIRHVQFVLLCEVVCGEEYESQHMLDSSSVESEEQHKPVRESCDSVTYNVYSNKRRHTFRKQNKKNNKSKNSNSAVDADEYSGHSHSFLTRSEKSRRSVSQSSRHEEANTENADDSAINKVDSTIYSDIKEKRKDSDDVMYKQVQIRHSYQAIPRYLLLVQPMIRDKSIHTSPSHSQIEQELLLETEEKKKKLSNEPEEWKEQTMALSAMRANSSKRATEYHSHRSKSHDEINDRVSKEGKLSSLMHRRLVKKRRATSSSNDNNNNNNNNNNSSREKRRVTHSAERPNKQKEQQQEQDQLVRSHSYSAQNREFMKRSVTLPRSSSSTQINPQNVNDYNKHINGNRANVEKNEDNESNSSRYRWHRSLLRRSHSAPHDDLLQSNKMMNNTNTNKINNLYSNNRMSVYSSNKINQMSSALSLLETQPILPPFNRVVEQIHARQEHEQQVERQRQKEIETVNATSHPSTSSYLPKPTIYEKNNVRSVNELQTLHQRPPLLPPSQSTRISSALAPSAIKNNNSGRISGNKLNSNNANKQMKSVTIKEHNNKGQEEEVANLPRVLNKLPLTSSTTLPSNKNDYINSTNNESSTNYTISQLSLIPVEFQCTIHPKRTTSLFCKTCQVLVCPYCASVGRHKTHDTQLIQDKAKEVANKIQLLCQALHSNIAMYSEWEANWCTMQMEANRQHAQRVKQLQIRVNEIKHKLDLRYGQLEQQLTQYLYQVKNTPTGNVAKAQHDCMNAFHSLEGAINSYQSGRQVSGDVQSASRNARIATLTFIHDTPQLIATAEETLNKYMEKKDKPESVAEMTRAMRIAMESKTMSEAIVHQCNIASLLDDIEHWGSHLHDKLLPEKRDNNFTGDINKNDVDDERANYKDNKSVSIDNHNCNNALEKHVNDSVTVIDDQAVKSMHDIERCLFDLQRGHIWVIQRASHFFAPGQDKTVSSTPFRLLGMNWELRITPVFYSAQEMTSGPAVAASSASLVSEKEAVSNIDRKMKENVDNTHENEQVKEQVYTDNAPHLSLSMYNKNNINTSIDSNISNNTSININKTKGHDEWLGLFLCPCEHTLRMDYRVIAFSDVVWKEWKVAGWSNEFVGKGWGLHPFLQRKELMRVDKLAREDMVKICIAPISGLY